MTKFRENKEKQKERPKQKPQTYGDSILKRAINHHIHGDLINAEKGYRLAIESGALNTTVFSNLGIICQATQRIDQAEAFYKKAIEINPNHPDPWLSHKPRRNL